jgi:hypothetical protein
MADSKNGVPIALNVKKQGSADFLRDARDPKKPANANLRRYSLDLVQSGLPER